MDQQHLTIDNASTNIFESPSKLPIPSSTSRLPRMMSTPVKSSLPIPSRIGLGHTMHTQENTDLGAAGSSSSSVALAGGLGAGRKRALPMDDGESESMPPPAGLGANKRLAASTSTTTALGTSVRGTVNQRPAVPGGSFMPQTTKKPLPTARPALPTTRRILSSSTSATASLAPTTSRPLPSSSTTASISRKASATNLKASTASTSLSRSTSGAAAGRSAGVSSSRVGGSRPLSAMSASSAGLGAGAASNAQVQIHGGKITGLEKQMNAMQEMMRNEQERIAALTSSQQALQGLLASSESQEREARRNLSSAGEEIAALRSAHSREIDDLERKVAREERERRSLEEDLIKVREELSRERGVVTGLQTAIATHTTTEMTLKAQLSALQAESEKLRAEVQGLLLDASSMRAEVSAAKESAKAEVDAAKERVNAVEEELRAAETIRRKLHNQVQELKGNIRVFARVRPRLSHEASDLAVIKYEEGSPEDPSSTITLVTSKEGAMGQNRETVAPFTFDKVFQPSSSQKEVFEEISMLAQSVCDGYNVCIFAYGQTGSGKSWTMEGGPLPEQQGMIPRAIEMVFRETESLKDRGWSYTMQGQFLEIYNDIINDLLGSGEIDKGKHEIKHGDGRTVVTNAHQQPLNGPGEVARLLAVAGRRRAVAATNMNERSSRSHSVFSLKVKGSNSLTGESCEGVLNLVDLAGSERVDSSGSINNKARLAESIAINSSLSALKDVIGALGSGKDHIPYRNSKLTYLLQNSLSGSSKTLMLCNLSPLAAHATESICSLRFAKLVNSTTLGTARRQVGAKDPERK